MKNPFGRIVNYEDYLDIIGVPVEQTGKQEVINRINKWLDQATDQIDSMISGSGELGKVYSFYNNLKDNDADNFKKYKLKKAICSWVETFVITGKFWVNGVPAINSNINIDITSSSDDGFIESQRKDIIQDLVALGLYKTTNFGNNNIINQQEQKKELEDLVVLTKADLDANYMKVTPQKPWAGPHDFANNPINNAGDINGYTGSAKNRITYFELEGVDIDFNKNNIINPKVDEAQKSFKTDNILDPLDGIYKKINEFGVEYFGGFTRAQVIDIANRVFEASGIEWKDNIKYLKGQQTFKVTTQKTRQRPVGVAVFYYSLIEDNIGLDPETHPEAWLELKGKDIPIQDILEQLRPFIVEEVKKEVPIEVQNQLDALPTTDYIQETQGQIIPFKDQADYEAYKIATGKQDSDFEDIPNPTPDLTNVAKTNQANVFEAENTFNQNVLVSKDKILQLGWRPDDIKLKLYTDSNKNAYVEAPTGNLYIKTNTGKDIFITRSINAQNNTVYNLQNPTNAKDATNKEYVDTQIQNTNEQVTTIDNKLNSVISGLENANIISFKGNWEAGKTYNIGDAVIHNNKLCISLKANNIGNEPINSNEFWNVDQTSTIDLANYARKDLENTFTQRQIMKEVIVGANATSNRIFASKFTYEGKEYGAVKATNAQGQNLLQFEVNFTDKTANISSPSTNNNFTIYNLKNPQGPREATNKQYVDNALSQKANTSYVNEITNVSKTTAGSDVTFAAKLKRNNLEFQINKLSGRSRGVEIFTKEGSLAGETTPIKYNITTNEQFTGNYYLGKPIYTRSFSFTNITSRSVNTILEGVENVVSSTTMVQGVRSQEWRQLPLIVADGMEIELRLTAGGKLYILNRFNEANINVKGVVQYTKI